MEDDSYSTEDSKTNLPELPVICGLVLDGLHKDFGDSVPIQMLLAIERKMGWGLEIIGAQDEAEDILLEKHHAFDSDIWVKVTETKAWQKLRAKVFDVSRKYLVLAIDEVVQEELQGTNLPTDPLL